MKRVLPMLLAFLIVAVPAVLRASEQPIDIVKTNVDKVLSIIENKKLTHEERVKRIYAIIDKLVDWDLVSRSVLGIYWRKLTPAQRKEFMTLFSQFAKAPYADKFERYSGEKVIYEGQKIMGRYADVKMRVITKKGQNIRVLCRMINEDGRWFVYDICIEGVSMLNNYRVQINDILTNSSFSNLINVLKKKLGKT